MIMLRIVPRGSGGQAVPEAGEVAGLDVGGGVHADVLGAGLVPVLLLALGPSKTPRNAGAE